MFGKVRSRFIRWRYKNKMGLFLIFCFGRGKGSFREVLGFLFYYVKLTLFKDGLTFRVVRIVSILFYRLVVDIGSWI